MQEDHLSVALLIESRAVPVYVGQESTLPEPDGNGSLHESKFILDNESGRMLIWRERATTYLQSNVIEIHSYNKEGGFVVWEEIFRSQLFPCAPWRNSHCCEI
ncbi:hypothetical protein AVEN_119024-1 [Araneus ventricosus]|uniref:Uncharacterized protein n=1 Tax=Araneus ventricosus TaxID=182803 RepID=A0A4Y2FIE1_ARAVE|nr:hypothetical protein AVEN_119024-1 [Araneus ventricosus]